MATSSILTKMYYQYVGGTKTYIADRRIIICTTDPLPSLGSEDTGDQYQPLNPPWDPQTPSRTVERIEEWSDGGMYSMFGVSHWQPAELGGTYAEAIPYRDGLAVCNIDYPFTDLVALYENDVEYISFEFTGTDHKVRNITLHILSYDPESTSGREHALQYEWLYECDNIVYLVWQPNGVVERYYRESSTKINVFRTVGTIPWVHKTNKQGFTGEMFGQIYINANYQQQKFGTNWAATIPENFGCYADLNSTGAEATVNAFHRWLGDYEPKPYDPDNPFTPGGISSPFGPLYPDEQPGVKPYNPNFSEETDHPTVDNLPTISATGSGFATIFTPTVYQLNDLATKMWNGDILYSIRNLVENVNDLFVSLAMVPFYVPQGSTVDVMFLNLVATGVRLTLAQKQFLDFDMGTINLGDDTRAFTSDCALDYSPFSRIGIYLPFIGYRDIDIDEVRGKSIKLIYRIDILSGACVAIVRVGGSDLYQFSGNCLAQIPITNQSISSLISDAVNLACAVVAPVEIGAAAAASEIANADSVSAIGAHTTMNQNIGDAFEGAANSGLQSATVNSIMGMKPMYPKTGSISGASAMMSVKQPYLYLVTPRQAVPEYYQKYCGFPSNITGKLSEFSGYTVVEDIRLNGLVATAPEVAEIYELLKKGVII